MQMKHNIYQKIRIFSNQSGDYGSGVDDATWASDTWETDKKHQIII